MSAKGANKSVKARNATVTAKSRRARAGARPNVKRTGRTKTPAGGGVLGLNNAGVGGVTVGTRQRPNGHNRVRVGGNAKGTPVRGGLGL
jgi:hypothetical protein